MSNKKRITALESSRGLLALWVVVGHVLRHAGNTEQEFGLFKFLLDPGLAVDVFIMISGFVIFFLLDHQKIGYGYFLVRRWFRLVPVFFVALILSALTLNWQISLIEATPWHAEAVVNDLKIHLDTAHYFFPHLLAHLTLLHGLIADSFLPNSQYAFIGQAWSISVEWQFYLLAPGFFYAIATKKWHLLTGLLAAMCVLRFIHYGGEGFAVNQAGFFIIGIASYFIWKHDEIYKKMDFAFLEVLLLTLLTLIYFFTQHSFSLMLWAVLLTAMLAEQHHYSGRIQTFLATVLSLPQLQWLGKISYSVYMLHMLVLYAVQYGILHIWPEIDRAHFTALMLVLVVPGTLLLAFISWHVIEAPGIELGRRLSQRWNTARQSVI